MIKQQDGYALLALVLVLFVSGSSFLIGALNNRQAASILQQQELTRQLMLARENLVNYAAYTHLITGSSLGPGYLPCPDADADGLPDQDADGVCTGGNIGRLPQRVDTDTGAYQLSDHGAGIDQQFWYAVSSWHLPTGTADDAANKTGSALSRLTLDASTNIAAVIMAPGEAHADQNRAANQLAVANYLEDANSSGGSNFTTRTDDPDLPFNDIAVAITYDELMQAAALNAALRLKTKLDEHHAAEGAYPADTFTWSFFGFPFTSTCVPLTFINRLNDEWMNEGWNANSNCIGIGTSGHRQLTFLTYDRLTADNATICFAGRSTKYRATFGGNIEELAEPC